MIIAGWGLGLLLIVLYALSLSNVLRCLYLCLTVEPGVIPRIPSDIINYDRLYKVTYRDKKGEHVRDENLIQDYFDQDHFEIHREVTASPTA